MESGFAGTKSENLVPSTPVSMSETAGSLSNAMSRTGISYRLQDNRLSLSDGPIVIRDAAFGAVILENGRSRVICPQDEPIVESVVCETPLGRGLETVYSWTMPEGYGFKYKVTRVGSDRLTVAAEFVNGSLHPVYLQRFLLLDTPRGGLTVRGAAADWMLATTDVEARRMGTLERTLPSEDALRVEKAFNREYLTASGDSVKMADGAWRGYRDDMTLYAAAGEGVSMAAVGLVSDVYFHVRTEGTSMKLEVFGDMSEVLVEPGEVRPSDEVLLSFCPWGAAQEGKDRWLAEVAGVNLTKKPVYGWCSWYRSMRNITQEDILAMTDYLGKNRNKLPMEVFQIDDGWQKQYYDWNEAGKFSLGMDSLARSIRQAGMVPGVWLSPVAPNPGWDRGGWLFPVSWYAKTRTGVPDWERLDPTNPDVAAFITTSLRNMYRKGYRYFKIDFNNLPLMGVRLFNPKMTRLQAQRELFRLYREAIGPESYLMACNPDQRLFVGYADANRIGPDCLPFDGFTQKWASDDMPTNAWGLYYPIMAMAGRGYQNRITTMGDPDVTYLGQTGKARPAQLLTYHSFIGLYGGFAMTSDHLYKPEFGGEQSVRMMEQLYPVSREAGHAFSGGYDIFGREFGYVADRPYGRSIDLILWNPQHDRNADLTMRHVPVDTLGGRFHVWSFWDERYEGVQDGSYTVRDVAPFEHKLLRLTALSDGPCLIGSNLHISMGATEVISLRCDGDRLVVELDPNAGARDGKLFFYSEQSVSSVSSTNSDVFVCKIQEHVYAVTLSDRERDKREILTLQLGGKEAPSEKDIRKDKRLAGRYRHASFDRAWLRSW